MKAQTTRAHLAHPTADIITEINQVVRGWAGYFHFQHCGRAFSALRRFVSQRVRLYLRRRTQALARVPRTRPAFTAAAAVLARTLPEPVFASVRCCALLGFLDREERRVGCLAHPRATGGPDLRDCGAYDVLTCDAFLCPSHACLDEEQAAIAALAAGDFYLYGLVVSDAPFLRAVLSGVAARVGARVALGDLANEPFRAALGRLLAVKEELTPGSEGLFGAFRAPRRPEEQATDAGASPEALIADRAGGDPRSGNDLDAMADEVGRRLDSCAAAYPRGVTRAR